MSMNVLLADDSVPAQNMGKKILMDAGYGVVTVNNGLEALRKIAEAVPDIAILDIFMPGYTGLEICKRLRASAATASVPVILTVGKLEPYRPEDGEEVQSNAVIVKPFAATELISAVRSLIGGPTEAAAHPDESKAAVDPLQESPLADDGVVFPAPPVAVEPAGAVGISMDESDEPLFATPAAAVGAMELTVDAPSVYGSESPLFGDSNSPATLAFDPDAKRTPFSASATDPLSQTSQPGTESLLSAFTEFDVAPEASAYSSPLAQEVRQQAEQEATHAVLDAAGLEAGAPPLSVPDSPIEIAPEQNPAELAESEEARRAKFEALFNSADETLIAHDAPSIAEPAIHTDSLELEMEAPVAEQPFAAPAVNADPFAEVQLEEVQTGSEPQNEISVASESLDELLPDLLEDAPTSPEPPTAASETTAEAVAPSAMDSPFGEAAALVSTPLPDAATASEAAAMLDTPRDHEPAPPAAVTMPALELAAEPEASQAVRILPLGVMQAEMRQSTPELLHSEAKSPVAEAVPVRVEAAPVQRAAPIQEFSEAEPLQSAALELEQSMGEIASPPAISSRLSEAERIHHAIELVFDRFKPLLVAAIVRELARRD